MMEKFYLGTYTKRTSKGIYSVLLNRQTKQLQALTLEAAITNPTYLAVDQPHHQLACVSHENQQGGITVFTINGQQKIQKSAHYHDTAAVPCYVSFSHDGKMILAANYHEGHLSLYQYANTLSLKQRVYHTGSSVHPHQTQAHVHYTDFTPDQRWIVVCDLGTDELITYRTDETGVYEVARYHTSAGAGPRHLSFHPTLPIAYVMCELTATIEQLHYDASSGTFTFLQQSILTPDLAQAWGSAIRVTKDGRFLYATNRGNHRIYAFSIHPTSGNLTLVQDYDTLGLVPRDFNWDQREQFLIVGHQESDQLTLFERNPEDGTLSCCQRDFFAPEVVCITPV